MCHGNALLLVITFLTVPVLGQMQFENMIRNVCEVTNMEKITLLVSILQLVLDVAVCVGSSPTVRYHLTNIAQLVEHMAESLLINKVSMVRNTYHHFIGLKDVSITELLLRYSNLVFAQLSNIIWLLFPYKYPTNQETLIFGGISTNI